MCQSRLTRVIYSVASDEVNMAGGVVGWEGEGEGEGEGENKKYGSTLCII